MLIDVISNLLSNAIQFAEGERGGGATITITPEKKDTQVIVKVKDTGTDIVSELLPRLFSNYASKSFEGTNGLGLFTAKSIVEPHGVRKIWTENNNNNTHREKGDTFYFTLPTTDRRLNVKVLNQ
jgi:signal transduction histidine kinase